MSTHIQWTDATWNPVAGCAKVSPGCAHCYAETFAHRQMGPWRGRAFTDVRCHDDRIDQPLHWRKPRKVFVNSMSDLFHPDVPDSFLDLVFWVMAAAPQHTFQVLTKRAERMLTYCEKFSRLWVIEGPKDAAGYLLHGTSPLANVWLGVSVENQHFADARIPLLLETPAAVRFISAEPLLGPINFTLRGDCVDGWDEDWRYNVLTGAEWAGPRDDDPEKSQHLDWVIVGGESGPKARPCDVAWIRSLVAQCQAAGVACFVKQLGAVPHNGLNPYTDIRDLKGGYPAEWPADLRVRQYPAGVVPAPAGGQ